MPLTADARKEDRRDARLRRLYGISLATYNHLHRIQNGLCAICQRPERRNTRGVLQPLCVDHSHLTKNVRGLLCHECNTALGKLEDSIDRFYRAIAYLQKELSNE